MLIGIMSDSHGRHRAVRKALEWFDSLHVSHIIHCGDVGGAGVFDEFANRSLHFVWGNTDEPKASMRAYLETLGIPWPDRVPLRLQLGARSFAVFHGHEPGFDDALRHLAVDYLLHGHSHVRRDERFGGKRIINPGALHRAAPKTAAVLNVESDELRFREISPD